MLEGDGTLELWPSPRAGASGASARRTSPRRATWSRVRRARASRTSSRPGPNGITYLVYGTREPNDICYYPRSNKISFRGVGVIGARALDYWDGEPPSRVVPSETRP